MERKLLAIVVIIFLGPLFGCHSVKSESLYQQEVRVNIGNNLVLGKVTEELADLGTIKVGDKASYIISVNNPESKMMSVVVETEGNIGEVALFKYDSAVAPLSLCRITVNIGGEKEGSYTGVIIVKQR